MQGIMRPIERHRRGHATLRGDRKNTDTGQPVLKSANNPYQLFLLTRADKETTDMATLKVEALPREFYFNGTRIPDPAPQMTAEEVRDLLTPTYPEIATATLTGPEDTGTTLRYTFSRAIGSKG